MKLFRKRDVKAKIDVESDIENIKRELSKQSYNIQQLELKQHALYEHFKLKPQSVKIDDPAYIENPPQIYVYKALKIKD